MRTIGYQQSVTNAVRDMFAPTPERPADHEAIRFAARHGGSRGVIDLRMHSGTVPQRVIAHLKSKDPGFEKLPWSEQCKRAAYFRQAHGHRFLLDDAGESVHDAPPRVASIAPAPSPIPSDDPRIDRLIAIIKATNPSLAHAPREELVATAIEFLTKLDGVEPGVSPPPADAETPVAASTKIDLREFTGNVTQRVMGFLRSKDPGFEKLTWEEQITRAGMFRQQNARRIVT
ncbi:MAG TPA: hypothetical protein VJT73_16730 [Polyangiaceae bacterium]|nr:hypothetical protein [Polyangiaceae bacterium]